ncbi:hypothetical protein RJ55_02861 [Drechmeria coniospora]|nr:hypothetical protein RJ55_02861 [Drechmeria coniospora]
MYKLAIPHHHYQGGVLATVGAVRDADDKPSGSPRAGNEAMYGAHVVLIDGGISRPSMMLVVWKPWRDFFERGHDRSAARSAALVSESARVRITLGTRSRSPRLCDLSDLNPRAGPSWREWNAHRSASIVERAPSDSPHMLVGGESAQCRRRLAAFPGYGPAAAALEAKAKCAAMMHTRILELELQPQVPSMR